MTNSLLYATTVLFWGTSWLAIKFQLGVVAPEASIVYRFAASAAIMMALCLLTRRRLRFTLRQHAFMAAQGLCLFSTNYLLIYRAEQSLTSGLVAVAFSTITVMTIGLGALFFGFPVRPRVMAGAALGLAGIGLVFWPEIRAFDLTRGGTLGLGLALGGTLSAATGMLMSARNQRAGMAVIPNNAWSMTYGFVFIALYSWARGLPFAFDPSPAYVLSLVHLSLGATVIGFWSYLTLVGRIGPDRASYASVVFPVVALALSTLFEGFAWTAADVLGVLLVLAGNGLVLTRGRD
jgi:drug/metabolite transporter (DMT)-like permease